MDRDRDRVRVDRWLWGIRLAKTRAQATALCRGGHVRVNGTAAKPATLVAPGDQVEARVHGLDRRVEVVRPIATRVGAPLAVECYVDHTPPPPEVDRLPPVASRDRGTGRPTKRDRRQIDRLRGS